MKLVTWNVNGIRSTYQKGLLDFVKSQKPDVLCLQETKAHKEQIEPELVSMGFQQNYWSSGIRKGYSGVATFSDDHIHDVYHGIGVQKYDSEGRIVWTRHTDFDLYNIYFPNGSSSLERHDYKQEFLKELNCHLQFEIKRGRQIIVVGDYNIAREDQDVYDPQGLSQTSGFLAEERQWFKTFLDLGFTDLYRHFHPDKKNVYSWWSYKDFAKEKNNGWRIDYICATAGLLSKVKSCDILMNQQGSDHCPVVVEMD